MTDQERFATAIARFDEAHAADPNREVSNGRDHPKELLYAQRMTDWLDRLEPEAPEPLRLAARCQHLCRWTVPRSEYPMTRDGYRQWRRAAAEFHAEKAAQILRDVGYDEATIGRVRTLVLKEGIKVDAQVQLLEDVICLVFLQYYLGEFAQGHDAEKVAAILRKTWKKMSSRGHAAALALDLPSHVRNLIEKALAP